MSRKPRPSRRPLAIVTVVVTVIALGASPSAVLGQQVLPISSILPNETRLSHEIDPALEIARESLRHIQANLNDYTALFVKRCRVDGKLPPMQFAHVKIRNRKSEDGRVTVPMGVYLDFLKPDAVKGREVLWVEGKNDGRLVVHEAGYRGLVNVNLDPNGYLAMRGQRYPITAIGIENLVSKMIDRGLRDRQYGECQVQIDENGKFGESECTIVEVTHPVPRKHFDFYRARLYFDNDLKIPIRYESWSWPETPGGEPGLEEEYTYLRVKVNVGLTDQDYDISNPKYRFR